MPAAGAVRICRLAPRRASEGGRHVRPAANPLSRAGRAPMSLATPIRRDHPPGDRASSLDIRDARPALSSCLAPPSQSYPSATSLFFPPRFARRPARATRAHIHIRKKAVRKGGGWGGGGVRVAVSCAVFSRALPGLAELVQQFARPTPRATALLVTDHINNRARRVTLPVRPNAAGPTRQAIAPAVLAKRTGRRALVSLEN
jgi:hypothetical protein